MCACWPRSGKRKRRANDARNTSSAAGQGSAAVNRALVTIACGSLFQRMAEISHPLLAAYAQKIGADFIVWDDFSGHTIPHYQKLELKHVLENYDRVLYVDTDILIRD